MNGSFTKLWVIFLAIGMLMGMNEGYVYGQGVTPVPADLTVALNGANQPSLTWNAVAGHGPQTGLLTASSYSYTSHAADFGEDQEDWQLGDPQELRNAAQSEQTLYFSSYGVDVLMFNTNGGPDNDADVFCLTSFSHTPFPYWPGPIGGTGPKAKFDQVHYFNADPAYGSVDMIDFSMLGVTHPEQLAWYPGNEGYPYSYLLIRDNDGDMEEVAAAVLLRYDRTFGEFSLKDNVIYADGQTTYNVYRRAAGNPTYDLVATEVTDSTFTDTDALDPGVEYEYVVTANDMFGESTYSNTTLVESSPFPVKWADFEATQTGRYQVRLDWATATEQNNAHFEVERSLDGRVFEMIGSVEGAGNSQQLQSYTFYDQEAPEQSVYYRLRQIDFNGGFSYSEIRNVRPGDFMQTAIQVYPNPAAEWVQLSGLYTGRVYEFRILDLRGATVAAETVVPDLSGGWSYALGHLQRGIYYVDVFDPETETHLHYKLKRY